MIILFCALADPRWFLATHEFLAESVFTMPIILPIGGPDSPHPHYLRILIFYDWQTFADDVAEHR
jgi:hypothetical protein